MITGMARAAGAEDAHIPDWYRIRAQFDERLAAEPVDRLTDDDSTLLQALGLSD